MKTDKKFLTRRLILIGIVLVITVTSIFAQTGETQPGESTGTFDAILKWITGGGVVGLVALISGFWKKGMAFIGTLVGSLWVLSGELGNILVQSTEANAKIRIGLSKLRTYAADGVFSKEELEDLILEAEGAIDEADDVPVAIKSFRDKFNEEVLKYKKK